jgi:hypothetical protein
VVGTEAAYPDWDLVCKGAAVVAGQAENQTAEGSGLQGSGHGSIEVLVEHPNIRASAQQSGAD